MRLPGRASGAWLALAVLLGLCPAAIALPAAELPSAGELLDQVVAQLPKDPLKVTGELVVRKRHGVVLRRLPFEMFLDWGAVPSEARYVVRDAFGADLEQLTVRRGPGGAARLEYATGSPLTNSPLPDLFRSVQQTDVSWIDLALSFLWWKNGKVTGVEKVLDRSCYVVDIPAPPAGESAGSDACYASVRLWIDQEMRMLFQAEGRDAGGRVLRRLWVRSFKRFDERWMIKDMEVQQYSGDHRTKLQIHDVTDGNGPLEKAQP